MNTEEIIKALREMAKYPTVTLPRDSEALKAAADLLAQRKYRRGDRLICLETEEYCVIHISGTDRQWVKFPDSHVGVYTNEQVAELFELLHKEPDQEPVAWISPKELLVMRSNAYAGAKDWRVNLGLEPEEGDVGLYTTPPQRKPLTDERLELIGHADLAINNIYIFNGYGEEVPEGRTPIYAGYKAAHGIKE